MSGNLSLDDQWIPCEKKMPEEYVSVLISHSRGVTIAWWTGRFWTGGSNGVKMYKTVEAWMPLPNKYRRGKDAN